MTWRRRISMLLMGALWAFVYGTFLELARVFFFEKLPKVRRLDELEQQLAHRDEELAILRAIAGAAGVRVTTTRGIELAIVGALREDNAASVGGADVEAVARVVARAVRSAGWSLWSPLREPASTA